MRWNEEQEIRKMNEEATISVVEEFDFEPPDEEHQYYQCHVCKAVITVHGKSPQKINSELINHSWQFHLFGLKN